jgi:nucleoside 2-deoxyribosyltransferase
MNIYFACSITGGRKDEDQYQKIVSALLADNHVVPTADLASSEVMHIEGNAEPEEVYERDTRWIRASDLVVAEISTPSHGVGYEIGYALGLSIPVICLYQEGVPVSKMISGNQDPNLKIFGYQEIDQAIQFIRTQIREIAVPK